MKAERYCLLLLKRRLRTAWELRQAMTRKGVETDEQERVIQRLTEVRLIDDFHFARSWIHTRDKLNPRGAFVLRQELIQKGVNREIIDRALDERKEGAGNPDEDQPDEESLARQIVINKERLYAHLDPEVRKRRLSALLLRRGFPYGVIRRILDA